MNACNLFIPCYFNCDYALTFNYLNYFKEAWIYSQMLLLSGLIYHESTYNTAITVKERESDVRITTVTPYLALTGELWCAYCEDFGEN